MEPTTPYNQKKPGINIIALNEAIEKYARINALIENGQDLDPELTKNFVTFPLSDNPKEG